MRRSALALVLWAVLAAAPPVALAYFQARVTQDVTVTADRPDAWVTVTGEDGVLQVAAPGAFPDPAVTSVRITAGDAAATLTAGETGEFVVAPDTSELGLELSDGSVLMLDLP